MEEKKVKRSKFSSNLGMMLACIGGAVGLGNVWGFPSKLGRGGGFYFLIIYVVVALLLGIPMTLSEYAIGRKMRKGPIAAWTEPERHRLRRRYGLLLPAVRLDHQVHGGIRHRDL